MNEILLILMFFYHLYVVALGIFMFVQRKKAVIKGDVDVRYFKSYTEKGTDWLVTLQNHFANQFQVPIIFFLISLLTLHFEGVNTTTLILAVAFVLSRLWHSYIHLTNNHILKRAKVYFFGVMIVTLMWVNLVYTVLSAS